MSFGARMSSACWATIIFSSRFSSSNAFSRTASSAFIPPYFAFQRCYVWSLVPRFRHGSPTVSHSSASFRMPTICAVPNRLFFTSVLSRANHRPGDSRSAQTTFRGADYRDSHL